ncbi:T9SS type A sorting domain-containing protein [Foetidibacter luteolus]|uniref:T9SS type A sorting domain-containing protein n=1 Tax=Foetidibacter luteolus TaxID=2608880 RepID=UPI001A9917EF|nr:T9SS type A sorting domain-containing protein [Foetidibacter luteolus]
MTDQLQRPLQPTAIESKKSWWIALMMPVLLLFEKAGAQKRQMQGKIKALTETAMIGDVQKIDSVAVPVVVNGKVTDEEGLPLSSANICHTGTGQLTVTDMYGNFNLVVQKYIGRLELEISFIGYQRKVCTVQNTDTSETFILRKEVKELEPVIVSSGGLNSCGRITGLVSIITVTRQDKMDTSWRKIKGKRAFDFYPNPAVRGSVINLNFKKEGDYSIQLIANNGSLLTVKDVSIIKGASTSFLAIPSSASAGIYYLRVVDKKQIKHYTEKIMIQ